MKTPACLDPKDHREPRAHQQEGQCMSAGGGPPVPLASKQSWSTLADLEGATMIIMEEQQILSVCQIIQNTCSMTVHSKATLGYMECELILTVTSHCTMLKN